jgi:hypothetical protein
MTRGQRPELRRASNDAGDPLDEALRQIGADMLDEPVPERLRQVLREARRGSRREPDSAADASHARRSERG